MNESRAPQAGSFQQMRSPSSRTRERDQADHARPFYLAHCSCGAKRAAKTELTLSLLFCSLLLYGSAHGLTSWWDWFRWSARRIISNYFWVIRFGFFFHSGTRFGPKTTLMAPSGTRLREWVFAYQKCWLFVDCRFEID